MKKRNLVPFFIFLISIGMIIFVIWSYNRESSVYEKIKEEVITEPTKEEQKPLDEGKKDWLKIEWSKLPKDCIAWIHFKHPKIISYPVMQGEDNQYYLHKDMNGKYAYCGSIFVDYHNGKKFLDDNTIVYGHNMANGTMFGSLKKYREEIYFKKNHKFFIYTRDGRRLTYRIYNAVMVSPRSKIYTYSFGSEDMKMEYLTKWMKQGMYKMDYSLGKKDKIITLSTCQYGGRKRLVIQGKLIKEEK